MVFLKKLTDRISELVTRINELEHKLIINKNNEQAAIINRELSSLKATLASNRIMLTATVPPENETLH